ncbi:hypothetical protein EW146_g2879 [Bondarzewia mesenterica]|uniref:DUF7918 domain-containing protein n=1 Tax=Bondarzewia mesenterica TaxID=1095465 RepID=A0A4S4LZK0_9AGAM|nr:hypothetical protein EW146_g2879 [Bondarzewia mesenterica]
MMGYCDRSTTKEFAIQYTDFERRYTMKIDLFIDGRCVSSKSAQPGKSLSIWGARTSMTTRAPFKFSEISLVDDDEADNVSSPPNIGCIEVKLYRARIERRRGRIAQYRERGAVESGSVSEKSKKRRVASNVVSAWRPPTTKTIALDPIKYPYATFRFCYRPRAILQAEGIMPQSNSANISFQQGSSSTNNVPHMQDTESDARASRRREQTRSSGHTQADEIIEIHSEDEVRMALKAERASPIRLGPAAGEIIDLTLD